ncbi:MAG: RHS repeat-associated core domain-containing protein, partial [Ekhidna sp.]
MNGTLDEVKKWALGTNDVPEIQSVYGNNLLSISEAISPDGRKSQTITNALGLPVATRKWDGSAWNTTYNVYDKYGRLRYVIPPKMANKTSLTDLEIDGFLFEQKYDSRGRVTESRAPGAGWNYVVYDQWNRPVMSRHDAQKDANGNNIWSFVKYDIFGRTVMTGIVVSDSTRSGLQAMMAGGRYEDVAADAVGYTINQSFPDLTQADFDEYELHSINYYDNYDFLTYAGWDAEGHNFSPSTPAGFAVVDTTAAVLGITTASKVRVLGTNQWLNSVVYYDNKLRAVQLISENHLGGTDRLSYEMDWEGKVLQSMMDHQGTESVTVLSEYQYDARGQHIQTFETIDGLNRTLVAEYNYNVLGQLMEKNIHSTDNGNSFLQSVDYRYNIRGWLSSINDSELSDSSETNTDLFGQELNYTNAVTISGQAVAPNYDGNITSTSWNSDKSPLEGSTGVSGEAVYGYTYTPLNQLTSANYATKNGGSWNGDAAMYSMNATYDANGNTQTLERNTDGGQLDDLSYTYEANSNKLEAVADNSSNSDGMEDYFPGTDYQYDAMGNRTEDLNKQITNIRYNHLQMVDRIEFFDNTTINFSYTATGGKLSKEVKDGSGKSLAKVDYVGTVEYLDDEINQVFIEGGRAYKQNGAYFNEYFITDNQGNNRVAFGVLPDRFIYTATMEQSRSAYEESEFSFPANIRSTTQNHTPLGSESVALNGTVAGKEVGPAKVLNITAGDEVDMQVWARYDFTAWNNTSVANIASIVSSAFGGASAGTGGESASSALNNALSDPAASGLFAGNASGEPEAYLQYMFFDANHAYVADGSGFIAVGADAEGAFAKLESGTLSYNEPGYLFIYVVNESNQDADVFFDDLKITHSSSSVDFKVSQVNEYYPYGLHTDKSWRHEGYVDPGMMYQAAYAGYDSLTGYYDFLYRSYDPALGQFFAVDPMAGTQTAYSPYHANYNNPVMYVDPLGLAPDRWPRKDSNPSVSGGGGSSGEPDLGSWVSVGMGSSWGGHGYGADYSTYVESDRERLISMLVKAWGGTAEDSYRGFSISGGNIGLSSAVYTITDYYTNGIEDEEHYISTSVEFEHPALGFTEADVIVSSPYGSGVESYFQGDKEAFY